MFPTPSSSPACCARSGTTARRPLSPGASSRPSCPSSGRWPVSLSPASPGSIANRSTPSPNGVYRQGGEHRVGREHRCRQKRIGVGPAVESFGEWLPLSVHPGTRPVRRDVCLVGRPLYPKTAESAGPPRRSTHRRTGVSQPETGTVQHLLQADGGALPPPLYDHHHQLGL